MQESLPALIATRDEQRVELYDKIVHFLEGIQSLPLETRATQLKVGTCWDVSPRITRPLVICTWIVKLANLIATRQAQTCLHVCLFQSNHIRWSAH